MIFLILILSVFVAHAGGGHAKYHTQNVEYYTANPEREGGGELDGEETKNEVVGYWLGKGAKQLGLTQRPIVKNDPHVAALYKGINPNDGSELRRGMTTVRRYTNPKTGEVKIHTPVVALDLTFSGPKSIDVLAALGSAALQRKLTRVRDRTMAGQVDSLERQIGYTRTGPGGRNREKAGLVCAVFPHHVNRDGEPKLHVHLVVFNVGIKADGHGGALDTKCILKKEFIHRHGQEFRDRLAIHFQETFRQDGLKLEQVAIKNGVSYRVVGIPDAICDAFSKRRQAIKKELDSLDSPTTKQVQTAVLKTRKSKPDRINLTELRKQWEATAKEHRFDMSAFLEKAREQWERQVDFLVAMAHLQEHQNHLNYSSIDEQAQFKLELPSVAKARQVRQQVRPWRERYSSYERYSSADVIDSPMSSRKGEGGVESKTLSLSQRLLRGLRQSRLFHRRSLDEKIDRAREKAIKRERLFRRKFFFLYATGQINRRLYLKHTEGKGLPKTLLGIEFQYWTGRIKLGQRIRLRVEHNHGLPKVGMPKTKLAINFAYAKGQISELQRLIMLKKREQEKSWQPLRRQQRTHRRGPSFSR